MKITRLYILIALFVITGVWAAYVLYSDGSSSRVKQENSIAVEDTASIRQVRFGFGDQLNTVKKEGKGWLINGQYPVDARFYKVMLVAFRRMEVKHPVAGENKAKVKTLLKEKGIKVEVTNAEEKKSFLIYGNPNDPTSTYYLAEGSEDPLIVHVPGVTGNLATLFALSADEWRIRNLFPSRVRDIQLIEVSYAEDQAESFSIKGNAGAFTITGIANLDSMRFYSYIAFYQQATVDKYAAGVGIDELKVFEGTVPDAVIKVTDLDPARTRTLRFYLKQQVKGQKGVPVYIEETKEWAYLTERTAANLIIPKAYFAVGKNQR